MSGITIPENMVDTILDAVERQMSDTENSGFCIECWEEQEGTEGDAVRDRCESCGKRAVYGAETLLLYLI